MTPHSSDMFAAATGLRVLLIDDGSGSLSRIHELLTQSDLTGFRLDCVNSLPAATNKFHGNAHDICIIDSFDNRYADFLTQARRVGSTIPVIVLTSSDGSAVLSAFRSGAADCLIRETLTPALLEHSICRVFENSRLGATQFENESRYLSLIENAKDIIYTHDLAGNYKSVNNAVEQLTGYTSDEILELNAKELVAPEFLELTRQMVERKLDAQTETSYEIELIRKDGSRVPIEVNTHLIYRAGRPFAVQGIARDLTQRRAYEAASTESERRYRELFENANDLVYVHDLEGNFTSLNKAGQIITGYTLDEALKMNVADVLEPEHLSKAFSMIAEKTSRDTQTRYELDIITRSGSRVSLEVSSRVIYREGKPVAVQGIGRDITERKRSEFERRVMLEIIQSVTITSNLDDLLRSIHAALSKILYAENCFVALHNNATGSFSRPFVLDKAGPPLVPERLDQGVAAYVFRTGEPLLLNADLFERLINEEQIERVSKFAPSWLGVPLKTPSETIGVLVVQDYHSENTYTQRDLEFLNSVGGQIALAIERKRAEDALKKSESEYRDIFDNAAMGIYRSTREGDLITANRALARILGYTTVNELLKCNVIDDVYVHPEERARIIKEKMTNGSAEALEVLWKRRNGTHIWVRLTLIPILNNEGATVCFDGFVHDITSRKLAEQALKESEERYQQLVELSPDGIVVHNDGNISFVNSAGLRLMGAPTPESVVGQSIYGFIDKSQRDYFKERVARLQEGEYLPSVEVKGRKFDGTEIECEVMSVPFRSGGQPAVQVVVRDITERKQVAQQLSQANRRALAEYERLVKRITVLGQSLGNARNLTSVLRAVRDFTTVSVPCDGIMISLYDAEKSMRRSVYCWVDDHELDAEDICFPVGDGITGRAIKSGEIVIENRYQEFLKEKESLTIGNVTGESVPRAALSAPMVTMGRTVGCIEIQSYKADAYSQEHKTAMSMAASLAANAVENVMLMEREKEQADQLRQSQKMEAVGQLAGGVAHDFNNLLTAIGGYSDLALRRLGENDPLRRNLDEIKRASTRAGSLTRQLLAFSRKQMLQAKVLDLNSVVVDMDRMLRRLIGEDIDLITSLEPSPCRVKADPGQIEQVLLNLAVNARDAMPRGGKLTIETARVYLDETYARAHVAVQSGHYILLAVSDNGSGMDLDVQKRVFEPFFTTKEVGKGTGLGLSTVYGIVKQSGGNIWVYSELGKGSTFKVYLPIVKETIDVDQKSSHHESLGGDETILLVEDEEMVRNLSREILEIHGYRVLTAGDGQEAWKVCEEYRNEIHLMVTDVVMPLMSGRELSERVMDQRPNMAVLFMSGYTDDAIVRHGVLDDGMPFLQKPFTPEAFARKVRELLEGNREVAQ